jgi:hypothetical protein
MAVKDVSLATRTPATSIDLLLASASWLYSSEKEPSLGSLPVDNRFIRLSRVSSSTEPDKTDDVDLDWGRGVCCMEESWSSSTAARTSLGLSQRPPTISGVLIMPNLEDRRDIDLGGGGLDMECDTWDQLPDLREPIGE